MLNDSKMQLQEEKDIIASIKPGNLLRYQEHLLRIVSIETDLKILVCDVARLELLVEEEEKPHTQQVSINKKDFELATNPQQEEPKVEPFDWNKAVLSKEQVNV